MLVYLYSFMFCANHNFKVNAKLVTLYAALNFKEPKNLTIPPKCYLLSHY